ncbi:MAG: type II 3-dehydroquinate dehydratase [Pseudomonadota bacterium]
MTQIHVLNGPNLNLLGVREPEIYGSTTLADIEARLKEVAPEGVSIVLKQTNYEGGLVELIHDAREIAAGVIINPAAYTHTSVAVLDALKMLDVPVIELHLSNPHTRETFRHHSFVSPVATGIVAGFGASGYELALKGILALIGH